MSRPVALITGITGQDGSYLASLLVKKGYLVHGLERRARLLGPQQAAPLSQAPGITQEMLTMHPGDLTDSTNLIRIIQEVRPDEIYNLGAQSHVQVSFDTPEYTANAGAVGVLRLLEGIRILGMQDTVRFYQASSSELYGKATSSPQNEETPFRPQSPYGVSKLYAYWIAVNYRESYGFFASNGILFNHESPLRRETFVTRKITRAAARIKLGLQRRVYLGNLDATRDWGHARDYVEGMWLILQQDTPDDFVLATGQSTSVRSFCERAFAACDIELEWHGEAVNEYATNRQTGDKVIVVDKQFYRPSEPTTLVGDSTKARSVLGWKPRYTLDSMIQEMVESDLDAAREAG